MKSLFFMRNMYYHHVCLWAVYFHFEDRPYYIIYIRFVCQSVNKKRHNEWIDLISEDIEKACRK